MNFLQAANVVLFMYIQLLSLREILAEFDAVSNLLDRPDDEHLDLMPIDGTHDFFSNLTHDISTHPPWNDNETHIHVHSLRLAKCVKLQNATCFGSKIAWQFTSFQLSNESSQENSMRKLYQFEASRFVPMCWAAIQPFLCAVYMPKCTRSNDRDYVYLPSFEMCRATYEPCRILYDSEFFPQHLRCKAQQYPCQNCTNAVRQMKFNATGQCMLPLVPTEPSFNQYPDVAGCGLQCKNPMYTDDEHQSMHALIFWGTLLCLTSNLFVIATFLIHDWKHSKHPAWNLFYISICFLFNWIGWMLQFVPGYREQIACRRDGTLRNSEPSAGENLACVVPFILIYYFLIAANVWFAIFTYAWYLQTKDRGSMRDRIDRESFYFHFIAWAMPFILTIIIMIMSEVDGNSVIGICFVGYRNRNIRNAFVLVPVGILSFGVSAFFAFKGCVNLNRIKHATIHIDEMKTLNGHIWGTGIRTMLIVCFIAAFFVFDSYEVRNADIWKTSLNEYIICKIKESHSEYLGQCHLSNRPSVVILQMRLLCVFGVNLMISSWCWTTPALRTWTRFIKNKMGYDHDDSVQITKPKHRIIADAYAKRMDEIISVSIENSHTDPAGLNFDMNHLDSIGSETMGATLTNYLSNIIHRRNAMTTHTPIDLDDSSDLVPVTNTAAATAASYQQRSTAAENNSELRHFSVKSRHSSIDSQMSQASVKISEIDAKRNGIRIKKRSKAKTRARNQYISQRKKRLNQTNERNKPAIGSHLMEVSPDHNQLLHHNELVDESSSSDDESWHFRNHKHCSSSHGVDSVDAMIRTFLQTNPGNHIDIFNPSMMNGLNGFGENDKKYQKYTQLINDDSELIPPHLSTILTANGDSRKHTLPISKCKSGNE